MATRPATIRSHHDPHGIIAITVFFYGVTLAGSALAARLIVDAVRADNQYLRTFEAAPTADASEASAG
jgi:hypothetical protein